MKLSFLNVRFDKALLFSSLQVLLITTLLILSFEGVLRLFLRLPRGRFDFITTSSQALYPPNQTMEMTWGVIPYTVKSNSLGFRGDEISFAKPEGAVRIAAVGDSMTDGFFVDNDATYPYLLQQIFRERQGNVEVINAAHGGSSIDKEYFILREVVLPLKPDLVLLLFVPNDISDIKELSLDQLLSYSPEQPLRKRIADWCITKTAAGEWGYDAYLRSMSRFYRTHEREQESIDKSDRYEIPGGDDFQKNVDIFVERWGPVDNLVLAEPESAQVKRAISNYVSILRIMADLCNQQGARLVFISFPSYEQIYGSREDSYVADLFREECDKLSVPFFDLTQAFKQRGQNSVLHLAPLDFHLNPEGNRVLAEAIAEYLLGAGLLERN
ncbi:MAG: SGNH/GDSL hydrolase family protein [Candidatus Abyssobacteria bacterium SURF_5]|uniref:SGNH/GDSL hydrolase family protein n=1 Tax=Abyssobacteria bacterium (strain SURF_5) TaxID=2093360 RepID=A0A3A4NFA6_ABYX5|nr:MAG: SGNH/GDSL hydrolase family protein [Candidatus Abyssubacteria bacterium SURF_5]